MQAPIYAWPPYPGMYPAYPTYPHPGYPFAAAMVPYAPLPASNSDSDSDRGLSTHMELAIKGWAGLEPAAPLPTFWQNFRTCSNKKAKQHLVESDLWPTLRSRHATFLSRTLLHEDLRDTIVNIKFSPDPTPTEKSHMGLAPLAFAPQSQQALTMMQQEAETRDRITFITSRDVKQRKCPAAPGTTLQLANLFLGMKACYIELFGASCPCIQPLTDLITALNSTHGHFLSKPVAETQIAIHLAPPILAAALECCCTFYRQIMTATQPRPPPF